MRSLNNSKLLIYSDIDYTSSVNYHHLYNAPITMTYKKKKFIIGAGTSDRITLMEDDELVYVLSENDNLSYFGLEVVDHNDNSVTSLHFEENFYADDPESPLYDFSSLNSNQKIKLLLNLYN